MDKLNNVPEVQFSSNTIAEILEVYITKHAVTVKSQSKLITRSSRPTVYENFQLWFYQPMTANKFFVMCLNM